MGKLTPALLLFLLATAAQGAELSELRVQLEGEQVLASLRLAGAFDTKLVERVESGLPTTLTYEFELLRDRKRWFDRSLDSNTVIVVGIYDAVRREYLVNIKLGGRLLESRMVHELTELERAMTELDHLPIFARPELGDRSRLLVRARVELGFTHLLGFIPSRLTTSWKESAKFRLPARTASAE